MSINVSASLGVQIPGGPQVSIAWTVQADGYDRLSVTIPHDNAAHAVQLQPSPGTQVLLLVVTSSDYSGSLTCTLNANNFVVRQPLMVSGGDIVNTLANNPTSISFTNAGATDVTTDLFVLRKAM